TYIHILDHMPNRFRVSTISKESLESMMLQLVDLKSKMPDPVVSAASDYFNGKSTNINKFATTLIRTLFICGAIGIKIDGSSQTIWSQSNTQVPSEGQIKPSSIILVHPIFWRVLGTTL